MSTIRVQKAAGDFFVAHKHWAQNTALSWESRGMLAYLFSKPNSWEVRVSDLEEQSEAGRAVVRRILKELDAQGYLVRTRVNQDDGTFVWISQLFEVPQSFIEDSKTAIPANLTIDQFTVDGSAIDGSTVDGSPVDIVIREESNNDSKADTASASGSESPDEDDDEIAGTYKGDLRYTAADWQLRGASWTMDWLESKGFLHPSVVRQIEKKGRDRVLDDWAHQLHLMVVNDGQEPREVQEMLVWLCREDNWWTANGNFSTLSSVRTTKGKSGKRNWDSMVLKFRNEKKGAPQKAHTPKYSREVNMTERRTRKFE